MTSEFATAVYCSCDIGIHRWTVVRVAQTIENEGLLGVSRHACVMYQSQGSWSKDAGNEDLENFLFVKILYP